MAEEDQNQITLDRKEIKFALWAELLYTFLPFIVSLVIFSFKGGVTDIIYQPAWSLAAAVLTGKTIVKFMTGLLKTEGGLRFKLGFVSFINAALFVFLLVPSLLILVLIYFITPPSLALAIIQLVLFALSVFFFLAFGETSEVIYKKARFMIDIRSGKEQTSA
jgi:hypothetical protein